MYQRPQFLKRFTCLLLSLVSGMSYAAPADSSTYLPPPTGTAGSGVIKTVHANGKIVYSDRILPSPVPVKKRSILRSYGEVSTSPAPSDVDVPGMLVAATPRGGSKPAGNARENCDIARMNMASLVPGKRLLRANNRGELVPLSDAEVDAERQRMEKEVQTHCKDAHPG